MQSEYGNDHLIFYVLGSLLFFLLFNFFLIFYEWIVFCKSAKCLINQVKNNEATYLNVCSCFSLRTVRTLVGLPSPDGPEGLLSLILLCDPDSLPESAKEIVEFLSIFF